MKKKYEEDRAIHFGEKGKSKLEKYFQSSGEFPKPETQRYKETAC